MYVTTDCQNELFINKTRHLLFLSLRALYSSAHFFFSYLGGILLSPATSPVSSWMLSNNGPEAFILN